MATTQVTESLLELSPTQFEGLVLDLCSEIGLRNAQWRTPGPDGGRDIQGEVVGLDFSGQRTAARWYVECKRYSSAIDWPTVWKKIAYADSHRADFLLFASTTGPSPACQNEINRWNDERREPQIRYWDGPRLERLLAQYPVLKVKYGLPCEASPASMSFSSLVDACLSAIQGAYGHAVANDIESRALESAAALSELLSVRLAEVRNSGRTGFVPFSNDEDGYPWLRTEWDLSVLDRYGARALLTSLRLVTRTESLLVQGSQDSGHVDLGDYEWQDAETRLLDHLALWAGCLVRFERGKVEVARR